MLVKYGITYQNYSNTVHNLIECMRKKVYTI